MDKELLDFLKEFRDDVSKQFDNVSKQFADVTEQFNTINNKLERIKNKDGKSLADRLDIIELAVSDTSARVKDVQKALSRVVRATAENWAEIVELKAVK